MIVQPCTDIIWNHVSWIVNIDYLRSYTGERNGNPLPYSCLENSMDKGARCATVHGVTKNWTQLTE